jgi:hypothetical protein
VEVDVEVDRCRRVERVADGLPRRQLYAFLCDLAGGIECENPLSGACANAGAPAKTAAMAALDAA